MLRWALIFLVVALIAAVLDLVESLALQRVLPKLYLVFSLFY